MKGIVFTLFSNLVEEKFGIEMWNDMINECQLDSGGIYVSAGTYADEEMNALLMSLSSKTGLSPSDLLNAFGQHMAACLADKFSVFFKQCDDLKSFLMSIDDVIHVEVKKMHPEAMLPKFLYEDPSEHALVMLYYSERKLCALAEGLIAGAASYYHQKYELQHTKCLHKGSDHCRFEIKFI